MEKEKSAGENRVSMEEEKSAGAWVRSGENHDAMEKEQGLDLRYLRRGHWGRLIFFWFEAYMLTLGVILEMGDFHL